MSREQDSRLAERNIPGMMNRRERFAEPEHADNIGGTVRRIAVYFVKEKSWLPECWRLCCPVPCAAFWHRACRAGP